MSRRLAVRERRASSRNNIFPMKVQQPEKIVDLLEKLKVVLNGVPPPWLRKILSKDQERTFEFEEETANG